MWSLWDFWVNHYSKAQYCWFRKTRTFVSTFVAQYSHPLNYKPICAASGFEPDTILLCLPLRKRGKESCYHYTQLHWLTPGLEPCSSVAQTDALPDKLGPTFNQVQYEWFEHSPPVWKTGTPPSTHILQFFFVIEDRLELSSTASKAVMLNHCTTQ